jgi:hypothetical protein
MSWFVHRARRADGDTAGPLVDDQGPGASERDRAVWRDFDPVVCAQPRTVTEAGMGGE